ncbi:MULTISPECIES: TadE/TadG family type IV pilus assembly protein [unclassified Mesorhizobium]|uniref:TadE/TadG family type IV pilus assembly protein n=1 Tax=unclassified Mesorhizobium TaxID=325217 RepID=UPI000FD3DC61|nr:MULTISPECIES: TadE/TadG family type IV pilus assembly protein [unclassified Mesorhizobium]RUU43911.1 pilus assembly protein [Mesorhizobium sp. M6A.T.Ca.TU.002.02.2.1]RVB75844.1 pilus assembly protein [Mesorhizobium sp. M6A.T.Cr.TU.014.01.1.1]RWP79419.1 MAG: pilus assembly protein [Mesorhizobium sp.]RWQ03392.1 MAG: pilus assembly protein [Mesorhizobium sp.]RWQ04296.1 MAG: pilus assembly protein [Mesorhizobium sp.]
MIKRFAKSEDGAAMVEMTIVATLLFALVLGFVDFGNAFYQWNAATKAVQIGARLASISDPVAPLISTAGPTTTPGAPVAAGDFAYVCDGATSTCNCTGAYCVAGVWEAANFSRIFAGDDGVCGAVAGSRPGMCDFYPYLQPANVVIRYSATGLGYQTRLAGSVPTITVSLQNVNFQFFFLQGLMGFANITMPSMLSTVTGEDLKSTAS